MVGRKDKHGSGHVAAFDVREPYLCEDRAMDDVTQDTTVHQVAVLGRRHWCRAANIREL